MLTLAVNENRDLYLDRGGNIVEARDIDALAATCTQVMSTLTGEMLYDTTKGVNYQGTVFAFGRDGIPAFVESGTNALLGIDGVVSVVYFYANALGQYSAVVETVFGQTALTNATGA